LTLLVDDLVAAQVDYTPKYWQLAAQLLPHP
jgi:hypothetical protein